MFVQIALSFESNFTWGAGKWPFIGMSPYMFVQNTGFGARNIAIGTYIFSWFLRKYIRICWM
jgi:hypothetical protein